MSHSISGRNIVVTGAAQGVGLGIVQELLGQGANVVMLDRNAERLSASAEQARDDSSGTVLSFTADVTRADGAAIGLKLAANIAAMLLAFIALISLANGLLSWVGGIVGFEGITLELIFGWVFSPLMFLLGVPWEDVVTTGNLMGRN